MCNDKLSLAERTHLQALLKDILTDDVRLVSRSYYETHFADRNCLNEMETVSAVRILDFRFEDLEYHETSWAKDIPRDKVELMMALFNYIFNVGYVPVFEKDIMSYRARITRKTDRLAREEAEEKEFENGGPAPQYDLSLYNKKIPHLNGRSLTNIKYVFAVMLIQKYKAGEDIPAVYVDTIFEMGKKGDK